jgi:hypothetical protein
MKSCLESPSYLHSSIFLPKKTFTVDLLQTVCVSFVRAQSSLVKLLHCLRNSVSFLHFLFYFLLSVTSNYEHWNLGYDAVRFDKSLPHSGNY